MFYNNIYNTTYNSKNNSQCPLLALIKVNMKKKMEEETNEVKPQILAMYKEYYDKVCIKCNILFDFVNGYSAQTNLFLCKSPHFTFHVVRLNGKFGLYQTHEIYNEQLVDPFFSVLKSNYK